MSVSTNTLTEGFSTLKTARLTRCFEAFLEIVFRLLGITLVYLVLNHSFIYLDLVNSENEMMLSLLILPILYILKESYKIIEPLTVTVRFSDDQISVSRGFLVKVIDTLEFKTVDNIETIETVVGKVCGYATIKLYAPGGGVEIPHLHEHKFFLERLSKSKKVLLDN